LPSAHRAPDAGPERRQHVGRVSVRPVRGGQRDAAVRRRQRGGRGPRAVHRPDLQRLLRPREPAGPAAADVRRLARVQIPRRRARAVHPSHRRGGRLPDDAGRAVVPGHPRGQDGRQRHRLFAGQHDQAGAVAADEPAGKVQGKAGGGFLLHACRRRRPGGHGVRGRARRTRDPGLRRAEPRAGGRLARGGGGAQPQPPREGRRPRRRVVKPRFTISRRILIGIVAGVAVGLFFGERAAVLQVVADAYVRLLQMTVLPYVVLSLVGGLGALKAQEASRLAVRVGCVLLVLWGVALLGVFALPRMSPRIDSASFFSTTLLDEGTPFDLLSLYIPSNPFNALANNIVPAVVLFSALLGVALIGVPGKASALQVIEILGSAVSR